MNGYGYAAEQLLQALNRAEVRTEFNTDSPLVHISWVQPPWYLGKDTQHRIGYTPWESTGLEKAWVFYMNNMDEIWTTSLFCANVYREHGVNVPITIIPHGVNSDHYPIRYDHKLGDKFTFLHIGGPTARKGAQRVFDAFVDLFEGNEDVELLMKSTGASEARFKINDRIHNINFHPQVRVWEEPATIEEIRDELYGQADCVVYPSNGEGFGLIPFYGIASGIPTICTNGTAMADYAGLSIPLSADMTDGFGLHLGKWCDPSPRDLREKMMYVYRNWQEEKDKVVKNAEWLHSHQSWDNVAQKVINSLNSKLDEKAEKVS